MARPGQGKVSSSHDQRSMSKGDGGNGKEALPPKNLSWESIVKSLIAGGVAGGV